jgi:hypothetical protein
VERESVGVKYAVAAIVFVTLVRSSEATMDRRTGRKRDLFKRLFRL